MSFNGYYSAKERANVMHDALANISSQNWKELPRENPASEYPSDFSLVEVRLAAKGFVLSKALMKVSYFM